VALGLRLFSNSDSRLANSIGLADSDGGLSHASARLADPDGRLSHSIRLANADIGLSNSDRGLANPYIWLTQVVSLLPDLRDPVVALGV
jgi:hypothetical protein